MHCSPSNPTLFHYTLNTGHIFYNNLTRHLVFQSNHYDTQDLQYKSLHYLQLWISIACPLLILLFSTNWVYLTLAHLSFGNTIGLMMKWFMCQCIKFHFHVQNKRKDEEKNCWKEGGAKYGVYRHGLHNKHIYLGILLHAYSKWKKKRNINTVMSSS